MITVRDDVHDQLPDRAQQLLDALRTEVDQLKTALVNRELIGMAKGVLIAEERLSPDEAFARLVSKSQTTNRKLIDICAELVADAGGGALAAPDEQ